MCDFLNNVFSLLDSGRDQGELAESMLKVVDSLPNTATGNLRSFAVIESSSVFNDDDTPAMLLQPSIGDVHPSVERAANRFWELIDGNEWPERAYSIIAAARWEFSRSQFLDLVYALIFGCDPSGSDREVVDSLRTSLSDQNWADTDSIARIPYSVWGAEYSSAEGLNSWIKDNSVGEKIIGLAFDKRKPFNTLDAPIDERHVLSAIALVWIDEAVFNPSAALPLMAEAALANGLIGFLLGSAVESSDAEIRHTSEMRKRGHKRWEGTLTQKMRTEALNEYKRWQLDRSLYRRPRDFRREMQFRFPELVDGTLKNWMTAWGRGGGVS